MQTKYVAMHFVLPGMAKVLSFRIKKNTVKSLEGYIFLIFYVWKYHGIYQQFSENELITECCLT